MVKNGVQKTVILCKLLHICVILNNIEGRLNWGNNIILQGKLKTVKKDKMKQTLIVLKSNKFNYNFTIKILITIILKSKKTNPDRGR